MDDVFRCCGFFVCGWMISLLWLCGFVCGCVNVCVQATLMIVAGSFVACIFGDHTEVWHGALLASRCLLKDSGLPCWCCCCCIQNLLASRCCSSNVCVCPVACLQVEYTVADLLNFFTRAQQPSPAVLCLILILTVCPLVCVHARRRWVHRVRVLRGHHLGK